MKQLIFTIATLLFVSFGAIAQQNKEQASDIQISGLTGKLVNNTISLQWNANSATEMNYWEVQASNDGKAFSTVGFVMGDDPKSEKGTFKYKQQMKGSHLVMKYYRVLHIEKGEWATASKSIGLIN